MLSFTLPLTMDISTSGAVLNTKNIWFFLLVHVVMCILDCQTGSHLMLMTMHMKLLLVDGTIAGKIVFFILAELISYFACYIYKDD